MQEGRAGAERGNGLSGGVSPRLLAFYLPQFHPNPENDVWWGEGYTEWINVARAQPLFEGHYQPRLPADLGFYDLRLPEVRQAQAKLAREHGIHGFCYYHYWFQGRRVLQRPFDEVLSSGEPDFPFCLAWANHTWTWKRDHNLQGRLADQGYSEEDDRAHIRWLLDAFQDERYIRVNGRPLFPVYLVHSMPEPARTFDLWRKEATRAGEAEPYICKMDTMGNFDDPAEYGCDAAIEFWPHAVETMIQRVGGQEELYKKNQIFEYRQLILNHLARDTPQDFKRFPCVVPQWDNTARWKSTGARILRGSTPELYGSWLEGVIHKTAATFEPEEQLVFINAWNEWGEGTYLEPDLKYGRAYLEETRRALVKAGAPTPDTDSREASSPTPASAEERYQRLLEKHKDLQQRYSDSLSFEERSPLLHKSEQRYEELLSEHARLRNHYSTLERNYENLQERFERVENRLAGLAGQRQELAIQIQRYSAVDKLVTWLLQLDREGQNLTRSRRWKIGDAVGKAAGKISKRPNSKTPVDHMQEILRDFRNWLNETER